MGEEFKSGFVSMMGRTNVGKSSIMNSLVKEKVAAIANKPQTTRNAIRAIVNRDNLQIIFIDTPGIHKPKTKLGDIMVETAFGVVPDVDVVLFVIDATSKEIGKGDRIILDKIKESKKKTILIINKIDLVNREEVAKLMKERTTKTGEPIYDVEATIYCLRNSHKGIIIGKDGSMLKRIASYARTDLEKMLQMKINLKVWVKVKEDWLNNESLVKKFKLQ